jgi:hypothetical protein
VQVADSLDLSDLSEALYSGKQIAPISYPLHYVMLYCYNIQVTDSLDLSDLSEALYSSKSRSAITQLACYEMSKACRVKPPPVPKVIRTHSCCCSAGVQ